MSPTSARTGDFIKSFQFNDFGSSYEAYSHVTTPVPDPANKPGTVTITAYGSAVVGTYDIHACLVGDASCNDSIHVVGKFDVTRLTDAAP